MTPTLEALQALIEKKYSIRPDPTAAMRDHGVDSLALVEFVFDVEDHFKVSLSNYPDIQTLEQLAAAIDAARAAEGAGATAAAGAVGAGSAAAPAAVPAAAPAGASTPAAPAP